KKRSPKPSGWLAPSPPTSPSTTRRRSTRASRRTTSSRCSRRIWRRAGSCTAAGSPTRSTAPPTSSSGRSWTSSCATGVTSGPKSGCDAPTRRRLRRPGVSRCMGERVVHRVPDEASGVRLDRFLAERHQELSRSRLQALVEDGCVLVDGQAAKPSRKLRGGEVVSVEVPEPVPAEPQPEALPLDILHEDADLLVVNKAAGMVVHPAAGVDSGTLVNAILFHVHDLAGIGGEIRPGIVHRLDKDTSGCLVVAKNERALNRLQQAF